MSKTKLEGSARQRLLAAASELFYEEGVHTVGIERVIARAGVAKASLYSTFGSKEELVRAYLQARADGRRQRVAERIAPIDSPRGRILAIFDLLGELSADPLYRGCAFVNASAEGPRGPSKVRTVCNDFRDWMRSLFSELGRQAGAADPAQLGRQLVLLYDGATVGASMDGDPGRPAEARALAEALLDAQISGRPRKPHAKTHPGRAAAKPALRL
jgi:AcrR family transcriptional regulator